MNCNRNPSDRLQQLPNQPFPQNQGMQQVPYPHPQLQAAAVCQWNAHDNVNQVQHRLNNPLFHSNPYFAESTANQLHQNNFSINSAPESQPHPNARLNQRQPTQYAQGQIAQTGPLLMPPRQSAPLKFDTIGHMARSHTNVVDVKNSHKESNSQNNSINWQQPKMQTPGMMLDGAVPPRTAPRGGTKSTGMNSSGVMLSGPSLQRMVPQVMSPKGMMSQAGLPGEFGPSEMAPQMYQGGTPSGFGPSGQPHPRLMPGGYDPSRMHPGIMAQGGMRGGYGPFGTMPSGMPPVMTPQNIMSGGMLPPGTQAMLPGMIYSGMVHSGLSQNMMQGMVQGMMPLHDETPEMMTRMVRPPEVADIPMAQSIQQKVAPRCHFANNVDCIPNSVQYNGDCPVPGTLL